jgi:hypothetical protein
MSNRKNILIDGIAPDDKLVRSLLSADAVRLSSKRVLELAQSGESVFSLDLKKLPMVADYVIKLINEKYPTGNVPYHGRLAHFSVGGRPRVQELMGQCEGDDLEKTRTVIDLIVTSVLLDAGSGNEWQFQENGQFFSRSEGLAVASFHVFQEGHFSSAPLDTPTRADAFGLMQITAEHIRKGFQVSLSNPLLGVSGRAELLHALGKNLLKYPNVYEHNGLSRPGNILDYLLKKVPNKKIQAEDLLQLILFTFGEIWPGRITVHDVNLGDAWKHPKLGNRPEDIVTFHKLSQWMTYSLLEPLEVAGFQIENKDGMTGLAEYRNGGLFIDTEVLTTSEDIKNVKFHPESKLIVEWRGLTVALLDLLANEIRTRMGKTAVEFPLVKVLEGGTWWAGRKLAQEKRGGRPPVEVISDGTVF